MMTTTLAPLSVVPKDANTYQSYSLRFVGASPQKQWIATIEYSDCTREFDGKNWSIVADKRRQPQPNLFVGML